MGGGLARISFIDLVFDIEKIGVLGSPNVRNCLSGNYRFIFFVHEKKVSYILEWGGDARTRDEIQARGAGRAGPACPPSVRACVRYTQKGPKRAAKSLEFH